MIISIASEKGGTGKSTISVNLAVIAAQHNKDILLIDADVQNSSRKFAETRAMEKRSPTFSCMSLVGKHIDTELLRMAPKYDHILVDLAGSYNPTLVSTLNVSDVVIVPIEPTQMNFDVIDRIDHILEIALATNKNLKVIPIFNKASHHVKATDTKEGNEILNNYNNLRKANISICNRAAFSRSIEDGCSVTEKTNPNPKTGVIRKLDPDAIEEIMNLYNEVFKNA